MDHHGEYLGQRSFRSNVIIQTHTHYTKKTDRTIRTTKLIGDN